MAVGKPAFGAYSATYWDGVWGDDIKGNANSKINKLQKKIIYICSFQEMYKSFVTFMRTV